MFRKPPEFHEAAGLIAETQATVASIARKAIGLVRDSGHSQHTLSPTRVVNISGSSLQRHEETWRINYGERAEVPGGPCVIEHSATDIRSSFIAPRFAPRLRIPNFSEARAITVWLYGERDETNPKRWIGGRSFGITTHGEAMHGWHASQHIAEAGLVAQVLNETYGEDVGTEKAYELSTAWSQSPAERPKLPVEDDQPPYAYLLSNTVTLL